MFCFVSSCFRFCSGSGGRQTNADDGIDEAKEKIDFSSRRKIVGAFAIATIKEYICSNKKMKRW